MICESCIELQGDSKDNIIRFITGHHPSCDAFVINKDLFMSEFERQINNKVDLILSQYELKEDINENREERESSKIINKLYSNLYNRYYPIVPNSYIFAWESDLLAVSKETNYITEYEVKISRNDFKADFKKLDKHQLISDCYKYNFTSDIPNYFYYATPPGLLDKSEVPRYAGLIEIGIGFRIAKRAPLLHKEIFQKDSIDILLKKMYYKYWNGR